MSLSACLQFGDNDAGLYTREYLVVECLHHFSRHHNHFLPDADARCEKVELTVIAPGKEDLGLYEWYIDQTALCGQILFDLSGQGADDIAHYKALRFENARCFSLSEDYHIDNARRRILKLELAAEQVIVDDVMFQS